MKYAVPLPPSYTLMIAGSDEAFPVNRVFCVGRNYAAHAREMGKDPDREPPFFFMKPACAVVPVGAQGADITYPPMTGNFHHELRTRFHTGCIDGVGLNSIPDAFEP